MAKIAQEQRTNQRMRNTQTSVSRVYEISKQLYDGFDQKDQAEKEQKQKKVLQAYSEIIREIRDFNSSLFSSSFFLMESTDAVVAAVSLARELEALDKPISMISPETVSAVVAEAELSQRIAQQTIQHATATVVSTNASAVVAVADSPKIISPKIKRPRPYIRASVSDAADAARSSSSSSSSSSSRIMEKAGKSMIITKKLSDVDVTPVSAFSISTKNSDDEPLNFHVHNLTQWNALARSASAAPRMDLAQGINGASGTQELKPWNALTECMFCLGELSDGESVCTKLCCGCIVHKSCVMPVLGATMRCLAHNILVFPHKDVVSGNQQTPLIPILASEVSNITQSSYIPYVGRGCGMHAPLYNHEFCFICMSKLFSDKVDNAQAQNSPKEFAIVSGCVGNHVFHASCARYASDIGGTCPCCVFKNKQRVSTDARFFRIAFTKGKNNDMPLML